MSQLIAELHILENGNHKYIEVLERQLDQKEFDVDGTRTRDFRVVYRDTAVVDYCLYNNAQDFRIRLSQSAELALELFRRAADGEPIDQGYINYTRFSSVLDALAAGDIKLAINLAKYICSVEISENRESVFAVSWAKMLYAIMLADHNVQQQTLLDFRQIVCSPKYKRSFSAYAKVFEAIINKDADSIAKAFEEVVKEHLHERINGIFSLEVDYYLCVWGIALANLAIINNVLVDFDHPLLPKELFISK